MRFRLTTRSSRLLPRLASFASVAAAELGAVMLAAVGLVVVSYGAWQHARQSSD